MPATPTDNKPNSTLVAFTPRQVLLGMKHRHDSNASSNGTVQLNREEKFLLHSSIAHYLHRCGFSKTLKKFRSEAQIEKDDGETSSVDLEEMCLKYLELCKDAKANINYQKEQGAGKHSKEDADDTLIADMDNDTEKKTKKKKDKSVSDGVVHQPGSDKNSKGSMNSGEKTNGSNPESEVKSKEEVTDKKKEKRKKSKIAAESLANIAEDDQLQLQPMLAQVNGAETEKKSKDKKKTKKDKPSCDGVAKELEIGDGNENVSKMDIFETSNNDALDKKKDSKKRKRPISEENDVQLADKKADEDSKRRKIDNVKESEEGERSVKTNANLGTDSNSNSNKENIGASGQVGSDQTPKTYGEQYNGKTNGTNENVSVKRSQKKQDSVEPKTVKAFQRVKIDEIKYADERLQDNSYWAKDGADTGYGAKAEEILGQVRGRDFRHEKTKKKRGSYRGGQIDLQSHSIKFNYSDDD